jgi:hypothetical protein
MLVRLPWVWGNVGAAAATAYTLSGPSVGFVGVPSAAFFVTPNDVFTGTITPSDGGMGGTFIPVSLTWATESGAKTFTYAAAVAGVPITIVSSSGGLLIEPAGIPFTASVLPLTVIAAIGQRAEATSALAALLPGGLTTGTAGRDTRVPYASIIVTAAENNYLTGDSTRYWRQSFARVSFFARTLPELARLERQWIVAFNHMMVPLEFADGQHCQVTCDPMIHQGEDTDLDGTPLYHGTMDLTILTGHSF